MKTYAVNDVWWLMSLLKGCWLKTSTNDDNHHLGACLRRCILRKMSSEEENAAEGPSLTSVRMGHEQLNG